MKISRHRPRHVNGVVGYAHAPCGHNCQVAVHSPCGGPLRAERAAFLTFPNGLAARLVIEEMSVCL